MGGGPQGLFLAKNKKPGRRAPKILKVKGEHKNGRKLAGGLGGGNGVKI